MHKNLNRAAILRRIFHIVVYLITLLVSLPLVTILLLANPEIQTLTSKLAAAFLSERIGNNVEIGEINLTYKGAFLLRDLAVYDEDNDKLLEVGRLEVFLSGISHKTRTIHLSSLHLDKAKMGLRKEQEDGLSNLAYFLQHFKTREPDTLSPTPSENPWTLKCRNVTIENTHFAYQNIAEMKPYTDGIDFKNIELSDINLHFNNLVIERDTISATIIRLAFNEKSGFDLKEFSGRARFSPIEISVEQLTAIANNTRLEFDLALTYADMAAFGNFIEEVHMDAHFRNTTLDLSDVGYFAPTMFSMTSVVNINGAFSGPVSDLRGEDFLITLGNNTRFSGSLQMTGLPDIATTYFAADITRLATDAADLAAFTLPGDAGAIPVPEMIANTGKLDISGRYTGYYDNFVSQMRLNTSIGQLTADLSVSSSGTGDISYEGKLEARRFDVGKLLEQEKSLGKTSFYLDLQGKGLTIETIDLTSKGVISSLSFMGYDYQNITMDGHVKQQQFNGLLAMKDENLDFTFNGLVDFNDDIPQFNFTSKINHADLYSLKLSKRDTISVIATTLDINFQGVDPDTMAGFINIDSTFYTEGDGEYFLGSLLLESFNGEDGTRQIILQSDLVDASFAGKFTISALPEVIADYVYTYSDILPDVIHPPSDANGVQMIDFEVTLRDSEPLSQLFAPQIKIAPHATLSGRFHSTDRKFDLEFDADHVEILSARFDESRIASSSDQHGFHLDFSAKKLLFSEPSEQSPQGVGVDSLLLTTLFTADSLHYLITWNDLSNLNQNSGNIAGVFTLENLYRQKHHFTGFDLQVDGNPWTVIPENAVVFERKTIAFEQMQFYSDSSQFDIQGKISPYEADSLMLGFTDINISNLDRLAGNDLVDIDGVLNGNATITGLYTIPNFIVDIRLDDLYMNNEHLGILELVTLWNDADRSLWVDLEIYKVGNIGIGKVVSINGKYYPMSAATNFDLDAQISNLGIQLFNPFISEFATISRESLASGNLKVSGNHSKPIVNGTINLMRTQFHILYLNTRYSLAGAVEVRENMINLDGLTLHDTRGRAATCAGSLTHNYFRNFELDLTIDHTNFRLLNTTSRDNELFYGDAVGTGQVHIQGPFDDLNMNIVARTDNGTRIMIPISTAVTVADSDFIIFRGVEQTEDETLPSYSVNLKGLEINFDLEVTPSAEIEIFLPFGMGNIAGVGSGDIGFGINRLGDFSIFGDYVISSGNFYFNFENLLGRDFRIQEGSRINWTGDPYDANVDIIAVHSVKTNLAGLQLQSDSAALYNTRVQVECIISLQNELFNPDIRFSMDFANVPDDTKEIIFTSLDTTDQSAMSQQILSLLLLGSFSYTANTPNFGATSFKLLSNQLSGWLSKLSKDFDIGISYQPGTQLTEDELEVALRTQLFNDRLSIDGNFGVRGTASSQQTSNVVGDINVEYKITQDGRLRVKAFNRTNNLTLLENNAPYTQGVGVFFRKEFERFGDLLGRSSKEREEPPDEQRRNGEAVLEASRRDEQ